jgi:hypothetical protein
MLSTGDFGILQEGYFIHPGLKTVALQVSAEKKIPVQTQATDGNPTPMPPSPRNFPASFHFSGHRSAILTPLPRYVIFETWNLPGSR